MLSGRRFILPLFALLLSGCIDYGMPELEPFDRSGSDGVFILNEGNFMYGNASLSYYDIDRDECLNDIFYRANGARLGDVAQSMTIRGETGYVVVNNSGVIYAVDISTFAVKSVIRGLVSPRYIHFVDDGRAYVTDLYSGKIAVVDMSDGSISGHIDTGGHASTERMAQSGHLVFVCCWSYDDSVLAVDTESDSVVGEIRVGRQPNSIVSDRDGNIWCLCDGGTSADAVGSLWRIDPSTLQAEMAHVFGVGDAPSELCTDAGGDFLYFLNRAVWRVDVGDAFGHFPAEPLIPDIGTMYYGLGVDPQSGDIYVADAVDYVQEGTVYRYSASGVELARFRTGINPGAFCFKHVE